MIQELAERDARVLVELGPGVSSVLIGRACRPTLQIHGVEHDPSYVEHTAALLERHGVDNYTLHSAPLATTSSSTGTASWYDRAVLDDLPAAIDALIIDGPPNWQGTGNRSPAWDLLRPRLRDGSLVLVDDTQRHDERSMVQGWLQEGELRLLRDGGTYMLLEVIGP